MASIPERLTAEPPNDPISAASVDTLLGTAAGARWRNWAKWIAVGVAAVALAILFGRFVNGGLATKYASERVVRGDLPLRLFGTGRLQPLAVRAVGANLRGTILEVLVRDNDRVRKGQLLARLDPAPFEEAIDQARTLLDTRQAVLDTAMGQERELGSRLRLYERVREHSGGNVPSDLEMTEARKAAGDAADAVRAAEVELASARAELAEREKQLKVTEIRSPIDGLVLRRNAEPGQIAGRVPGQGLFAITAPSARLRLETTMDGVQARMLQQAGAARMLVTLPSGRVFPATIVRVSRIPAPPQSIRNATPTHSVPVGLSLEIKDPGLGLRPGIAVSMRIDLGQRHDMLIVSDAALRFARASDAAQAPRPSGEAVYVRENDGMPHRVPVVTKGGDGYRTTVSSDLLKPDMRVITGLR